MMKIPESLFEGKKKYLTVFVAGALADFALAPFDFLPILFISFPLFLIALEKITPPLSPPIKGGGWVAFWLGWWFGFGHFLFGLYWISNSLLIDADRFAWLIPFAAAGIPAVLAIYIALVGLVYHAVRPKFGEIGRILIFINLWVLAEILRSYLFTGFPWNLIGYSSFFALPLAHLASLGGIYLLSWVVMLIAFLPLAYKSKLYRLAVILIVGFSFVRFGLIITNSDVNDAINVRIVQPNIEQTLKWDAQEKNRQLYETLHLTGKNLPDDTDLIILPETGIPFHLNREDGILDMITSRLPENTAMVTGALRSVGDTRESYKVWNSMYLIDKSGIRAYYDKYHLVPFGEYVPFSEILPREKITQGGFNLQKGENIMSISTNSGLNILPQICYEIIFPDYSQKGKDIDLIINATNDAWFGVSSGPYQHLASARMRAIERGVPVIRAANTGVSAVINKYGIIQDSIPLNQKGYIDVVISKNSISATTYSAIGKKLILLLIVIITVFLLFRKKI